MVIIDKLRLKAKFLLGFLLMGLAPLTIVAAASLYLFYNTILQQEDDKVQALLESRKGEVVEYLRHVGVDVQVLAQSPSALQALRAFTDGVSDVERLALGATVSRDGIDRRLDDQVKGTPGAGSAEKREWARVDDVTRWMYDTFIVRNPNPLGKKNEFNGIDDGTAYAQTHLKFHPFFKAAADGYFFYDIFLVDKASGRVVYTVFKELDFGTNLYDGPYAETDLAEVVRRSMDDGRLVMSDYKTYAPSYNAAASFLSYPIYDGKTVVGALAIQLPVGPGSRLSSIMQRSAGLGETGQTILIGEDSLLRSDDRFKEGATVLSALHGEVADLLKKNPNGGRFVVDLEHIKHEITFQPLGAEGKTWFIMAEKEYAELMAPVMRLVYLLAGITAFITLGIIIVGNVMSSQTVAPINAFVRQFKRLSDCDLTPRVHLTVEDEMGDMATQFNDFAGKLSGIVRKVSGSADVVAGAAEEITATIRNLEDGAKEQQMAMSQIAAAIGEASTTVTQVGDAARDTNTKIRVVSDQVMAADTSMRELSESAAAISGVIRVINEIAEQTNLLALNAAIEAARAGEAGKGFAVVAEEVRKLASSTSRSTREIGDVVERLQAIVRRSMDSSSLIRTSVEDIRQQIDKVAGSIQQQSTAVEEISASVQEFHSQIEHSAKAVAEVSSAAQSLAAEATGLTTEIRVFKTA